MNLTTWWAKQWWQQRPKAEAANIWQQGITQAAQGALLSWEIVGNGRLHIVVQGSFGKTYQQQIQLPPWGAELKALLLDYFKDHPLALAQLSAGSLPKDLQALLETQKSAFLPETDKMACSCSSHRGVCAHLAATWAALAQHLEQAPYFLFQWQGHPILEILNYTPQLQDLGHQWKQFQQTAASPSRSLDVQALPDLSKLKPLKNWFLHWLDPQAVFYPEQLGERLQKQFQKAIRRQQQLAEELDQTQYAAQHQQIQRAATISIIINQQGQLVNVLLWDEGKSQALLALDQAMTQWVGILESTVYNDLERYPDTYIIAYWCYRFAVRLLETKSLVPQWMQEEGACWLQWWPALLLQDEVARILAALEDLLADDFLLLDQEQGGLTYLTLQAQFIQLCQLVVGYFIQLEEKQADSKDVTEQVEALFWGLTSLDSSKDQALIRAVEEWLRPLHQQQGAYYPILNVLLAGEPEDGQFQLQWYVAAAQTGFETAIPLSKFITQKNIPTTDLQALLLSVQLLSRCDPSLEALLSKTSNYQLQCDKETFEHLFFEVLPLLQELKIAVRLPSLLQQLTQPHLRPAVKIVDTSKSKKTSLVGLKQLLSLEWQVVVGDEVVELAAFLQKMRGKQGLQLYKGRYIYLDPAALEAILKQLQRPPVATADQCLRAVLSGRLGVQSFAIDPTVQAVIQRALAVETVAAPQSLQATLRPYQQDGYAWMCKHANLGMGALIADDMGLGKTLQVIALLLKFWEEGYLLKQQVLIIVPTSLLNNWKRELEKFAPKLDAQLYHGTKRKWPVSSTLVITSYGIARTEASRLGQVNWYAIVIDEAQQLKNPRSKQTVAIKGIEAPIRIAMSGTPVENRLTEYWSIMDYVYPNYLGSLSEFETSYSQPIEQEQDRAALQAFRQVTAPFILRRLKSDKSIIKDLPEKIEQTFEAKLTPIQAELYQTVVGEAKQQMRQHKGDKKRRQGLLLQVLGRLKQICNHPYQYTKTGGKGPEQSGKGQVFLDLLTRIERQGEKTLLFTQYRQMGALLEEWIEQRFGWRPMYLHGACSRQERDRMVQAFQEDKRQRIFLLSLKAAGTGLTLTAANHVIHYDRWWNPAVEAQATDRAYRIGQEKQVQVYRLLTKGTVEEKIAAMILQKQGLADQTVVLGNQWLGGLSDDDLMDLLVLGSQKL